jgi:hypothetical protein
LPCLGVSLSRMPLLGAQGFCAHSHGGCAVGARTARTAQLWGDKHDTNLSVWGGNMCAVELVPCPTLPSRGSDLAWGGRYVPKVPCVGGARTQNERYIGREPCMHGRRTVRMRRFGLVPPLAPLPPRAAPCWLMVPHSDAHCWLVRTFGRFVSLRCARACRVRSQCEKATMWQEH